MTEGGRITERPVKWVDHEHVRSEVQRLRENVRKKLSFNLEHKGDWGYRPWHPPDLSH